MFKKGDPKPPTSGRKPGVQNKTTKAVKDFFIELTSDPEVQDAVRAQIMGAEKGSMAAFLGAASHVIGKPKETVQVDVTPNMAELLTLAIQGAQEKKVESKGGSK